MCPKQIILGLCGLKLQLSEAHPQDGIPTSSILELKTGIIRDFRIRSVAFQNIIRRVRPNPVIPGAARRRFPTTMEKKPKKLTLNQETLRNLTQEDLARVAGGSTINGTCPSQTCVTCHVLSICEICGP